MRITAAWVAVVVACGSGLVHREPREIGADAIEKASGNTAAIEDLLQDTVINGGLWFDDPACMRQFPTPGEVRAERLHAFAACLADLHFHVSMRKDPLADVIVLTYAPGIEIEARVVPEMSGPRIRWIGYESRRDAANGLPSVSPDVLDALRTTGNRNGPLDPAVASGLELDEIKGKKVAYAWVNVCLDGDGAVTTAHARVATSPKAAKAFTDVAAAWKFQPFTIRSQTLPVCSLVKMVYPPDASLDDDTLPWPLAPSADGPRIVSDRIDVPPVTLEHRRIAGNKLIVPDDHIKVDLRARDIHKLVGTFRMCLDTAGHVEQILPLRSTGFAEYDRELVGAMRAWAYTPYEVDGKPVPVCSFVTFIYSQR